MPLFVVGEPRSGTKLLTGLLNQHSEIAISGIETEFLIHWAENWQEYGDLSIKSDFHRFYKKAIRLPFFVFQRRAGNLIDEDAWYESCESYTVQGVFESLIRYEVGPSEATLKYWGDKSPSYLTKTTSIRYLFPGAKFIHIVRDVRDYCLSINKAFGKNIYRAAQRWESEISRARIEFDKNRENVIEIRYEDLIASPELEMQKICKFLGITYQPEMCYLSVPVEIGESFGDAKDEVNVLADNSKKYLRELSGQQVRRIEEIASPVLNLYQYELLHPYAYKPLSNGKMVILKLLDGLNLFRRALKKPGSLIAFLGFHIRYQLITKGR